MLDAARLRLELLQRNFSDGWSDMETGERSPFVHGLIVLGWTIEIYDGAPCVVLDFAHTAHPAERFRHRFPPTRSLAGGDDDGEDEAESDGGVGYADIHFMEEIETGKLHRTLRAAPHGLGPVWTDFSWGGLRSRWSQAAECVRRAERAAAPPVREAFMTQALSVLSASSVQEPVVQAQVRRLRAAVNAAGSETDLSALWQECHDAYREGLARFRAEPPVYDPTLRTP